MMVTFLQKTFTVQHWVWLYVDVKKEDERSACTPLDMSFLERKKERRRKNYLFNLSFCSAGPV